MIPAVRAAIPAGRPAAKTLITTRARRARRSMLQSSYPVASTDQSPTSPRPVLGRDVVDQFRQAGADPAGPAAVPSEASPVTEPGYSTGLGRNGTAGAG